MPYLIIPLVAFLAGMTNAIAGGGTFFTFPALTGLAGLSERAANITSTIGLWPGAAASVWSARRELKRLPVLGVCLGHQCIGYNFGGIVERAGRLMHGKTDKIYHDGKTIYVGMPNPFTATRYHSLIIRNGTLPPEFEVSAWTDQDEIMGVRHKTWPLEGVQYHPESFLTEQGEKLLANFLKK